MSWEVDYTRRYPCPCGKGEIEEVSSSNDWGKSETKYDMLCPDCKERYVYDPSRIGGHPGDIVERGWVLKSSIDAEEKYVSGIEAKVHELYYGCWQNRLLQAKSKKDLWAILTQNGKYYPSLSAYYRHSAGKNMEVLKKYADTYFSYHDLKRIFEVCIVKPDWDAIGANEKDRERFKPDLGILNNTAE